MIGPLRARTCSMLFRFLEKTASSGVMKTEGRLRFHERNDAVLQLRARVALRVEVGDFLHLERGLERDRKIELPAEEEHPRRAGIFFRDLLDLVAHFQDLLDLFRQSLRALR